MIPILARIMTKTAFMKSPQGQVRRVDGPKLVEAMSKEGWTPTDERPAPKAQKRKPGSYYVNTTALSGW